MNPTVVTTTAQARVSVAFLDMMIAGVVTSPTIISRKLCNLRYTKNVKITVRGDLGAAFTAIDEDRQVSSVLSE
jgi:hypothetical protein